MKARQNSIFPSLFPSIHNRDDHEHRRMISQFLCVILFMEDNLKTLERIRQAGLRICLFIGKNDGCRLGGNNICVNEIPYFIQLIDVLGDEWLYVTDHGPITRRFEDVQQGIETYFGPIPLFVETLTRELGLPDMETALGTAVERLKALDQQTLIRLLDEFRKQYGPLMAPYILESVPFEDWCKLLQFFGWDKVERWEGEPTLVFLQPYYSDVLTYYRVRRSN